MVWWLKYHNFKGYMLSPKTIFIALPSMGPLAQSIAHSLGGHLVVPELIQFADGEIEVHLPDQGLFQGKNVCIIQSTNPPVHDGLIQLMLLANELHNAGAQTITALIPYFGYARHDSSTIPGGQGSMALMVKLLKASGINNIITVQLHNPAIISQLILPMHSISLAPIIAAHIKQTLPSLNNVCLIAPDQGAQLLVSDIARILGIGFVSFTKERYQADKTKIVATQGSCKGTTAIVIDDIINTGGTALNVCEALHQQGYARIYGYFVHAVLSADAAQKLQASSFTQIFVSNSIPQLKSVPKIKIFDIAKVITEVLST